MTLKELQKIAAKYGLEAKECGNDGHFQILGPLLVNFYPNARKPSAYIAGTGGGRKLVDADEACKMAITPVPMVPKPLRTKRRRKGYTNIKRQLLVRRGNLCHWCKVELTLDTATLDHRIPLASGGLDNDNNRVLACDPCNQKRGHKMPEITGKLHAEKHSCSDGDQRPAVSAEDPAIPR